MNSRLEERDRFTARCFKWITDKVIEEVLVTALGKKKVAQPTNMTPSDKLVIVYLGSALYTKCLHHSAYLLGFGLPVFFFFNHLAVLWN